MARKYRRPESDVPERPITFNAAEHLGAFELAQLWADRAAWPTSERTTYDELAELACMAALAKWLDRWLPVAIHGAMMAGAKPEAVAGACGMGLDAAFQRWNDWAKIQRDYLANAKPGITHAEYDAVKRRFREEVHASRRPT